MTQPDLFPDPSASGPTVGEAYAASESSAIISDCGQYRYRLIRHWGPQLSRVCWIMLNPSTADASLDDQTIRKCKRFSTTWGYGGMVVVNLFAWRSTDPTALRKANEPIGSDNDDYLKSIALASEITVCAWGNHGVFQNRCFSVRRMLESCGVKLHYLELSKDGYPKHPLYLKETLKPTEWVRR